jgi:hypothetical protein
MGMAMIEFLTSDTALLVWTGFGLMATAMSIVRDTRTQRMQRTPVVVEEPQPLIERREKIAA